ncbi:MULTISPECIES: o-succinylbenzoate--CoA ligase [unclassified Cytobacillus]|uniref:o-succinylbenzoate--CoA ligase n=1 Tax=unclassified Cytobacillus TaxID=2675268 RepID=UPI002040F376|nr:o-succinylbenzoate--CoA ligase [Cytobacillus sp. AMY 15.2]MCM3093537.1 o-succinylbenzoate--CoA ligase [Cytobacillus sp. AMY 15.2]
MEAQIVPNFLQKRAILTPERPALSFLGKTYTFSEVYDRACTIAGQLQASGLTGGQFAGVLLRNHEDTVFILLALQLINVKAVILNNRLTAEELIWQMDDSKSAFLLTESSFDVVSRRVVSSLGGITAIHKEELFRKVPEDPSLIEELNLNEVCTVMYTSGTTGNPKGVMQTYGNHWWSAVGSALNLGLNENDCWLCAVPIFHISGYSILMRSIIYGMKMVLFESFHEKKAIKAISCEKVTIMSVVSTMLTRIADELKEDRLPEFFRCMLLGGGPAAKSLLEGCREKGIPVYQTYGMTETSSQIVTLAPEYSFSKLGSAGKPLFPSQLKIINPNGDPADSGEAGEILVKGPNVTKGYLNREEETVKKLKDGWLSTGDIGYVDNEGFLYVLDRRSDLIISGGENIYPAEIEGVLSSHSQISDAGVIGMKDKVWGEVPVAFVAGEESLDVKEVIEYCLEKLAKYKVPKKIIMINEVPRNASKKILRRKLRELLEESRN